MDDYSCHRSFSEVSLCALSAFAVNTLMVTNEKDKILLSWSVRLIRRRPRRALLAIAAVFFASLAVLLSSHNPLLAGIAVLLLLSAISEYLFPIHYRLTEQGIHMRNFLTFRYLPWPQVRYCYKGSQGIKLSPLPNSSWRAAFRGISLWVEGEEQERVAEIIRKYRPLPPETAARTEEKSK